ncbi:MAG: hypothetical protein JW937_04955 [Candidatus Omnitrophica bacterium]|nr:hypothetical protein [Candidatus Omnitrophota bacterium]
MKLRFGDAARDRVSRVFAFIAPVALVAVLILWKVTADRMEQTAELRAMNRIQPQVQGLLNHVNTLNVRLKSTEEDRRGLTAQVNELNEGIQIQQAINQDLESQLAQAEIQVNTLQRNLEEIRIHVKQSEDAKFLSAIVGENKDLKSRIAALDAQMSQAAENVENLTRINESLNDKVASYSSRKGNRKKGTDRAEARILELELQLAKAEESKASLEGLLRTASKRLSQQLEVNQGLTSEIGNLTNALRAKEERLAALAEDLEALSREETALREQVARVKDSKSKLEQEVNDIRGHMGEVEGMYTVALDDADDLGRALVNKEKIIVRQSDEIAALEQAIEAKQLQQAELSGRLAETQGILDESRQTISDLAFSLDNTAEQNRILRGRVVLLEGQQEEMSSDLALARTVQSRASTQLVQAAEVSEGMQAKLVELSQALRAIEEIRSLSDTNTATQKRAEVLGQELEWMLSVQEEEAQRDAKRLE